jgi:hypothetical protein
MLAERDSLRLLTAAHMAMLVVPAAAAVAEAEAE